MNMSDKKIISFIVPVYNGEKTLRKCVDSLLFCPDSTEVIIVNDGSTDGTLDIALEYERNNSETVCVINQANGGHGSVINAAVKMAAGKYFKVVDADDWIVKEGLGKFIEELSTHNTDAVLTNFRTVNSVNGVKTEYKMLGAEHGRNYDFNELWQCRKAWLHVCKFHGITYKTDFYRACGITLPEKIFYEDEIFSTLPFSQVKRVLVLNILLYDYAIASGSQSISDSIQASRVDDLEKVFWVIHTSMRQNGNDKYRQFCEYKLHQILLAIYGAALIKNHNKSNGRDWTKKFRKRLFQADAEFAEVSKMKYFSTLFMSYVGFNGGTLSSFRDNPLYRFARRKI